MKRYSSIVFHFFFILFIFSCEEKDNEMKCCSCLETVGKSDAYTYPVRPGTPEWAGLTTGSEKYEACQIPDNVLNSMCTIGVVNSWRTYPLRALLMVWPSLQSGFDHMIQNFNGLKELTLRRDAAAMLLKDYKQYDPLGYPKEGTSEEKGAYSLELLFQELTLAQYVFIQQLSVVQKKEMVKEALLKRELKSQAPDIYSHVLDALIMVRVMIDEQYEPFLNELSDYELDYFIETGNYIYPADSQDPEEDLLKIVTHAKSYIQ